MYILIAGAGLVGSGLAHRLNEAGHDVVVVDADRDVCEQLTSRTGVQTFHGTAANIDVLEQAGADKAEVAVGTMRSDADNLAFSLLAKSCGVPRVIARMRNQRYQAAYETAGVTTTIHVADVFVNQLILEIEEPHLRRIATFGPEKTSIVVDTVPDNASISGKSVSQIASDPDFPADCVITGIYRPEESEFLIPRGDAVIHGGDRVFLVAAHDKLRRATKLLHRR